MAMTAKCCDLQRETKMGEEKTSTQGTALNSSLKNEFIEFGLIWQRKVIPGRSHRNKCGFDFVSKNE